MFKNSSPEMFYKKVFLKNSQKLRNFIEKLTPTGLFWKLQVAGLRLY